MGDPTRAIKAPDNWAPGVIGTHKPLHHDKVVAQGGVMLYNNVIFLNNSQVINVILFDPACHLTKRYIHTEDSNTISFTSSQWHNQLYATFNLFDKRVVGIRIRAHSKQNALKKDLACSEKSLT